MPWEWRREQGTDNSFCCFEDWFNLRWKVECLVDKTTLLLYSTRKSNVRTLVYYQIDLSSRINLQIQTWANKRWRWYKAREWFWPNILAISYMIWVISIYLRLSKHFESLNCSKATNKITASPLSRESRDKYVHGSRAVTRVCTPYPVCMYPLPCLLPPTYLLYHFSVRHICCYCCMNLFTQILGERHASLYKDCLIRLRLSYPIK